MTPSINVFIGSTNPNKVHAALETLNKSGHPLNCLRAIPHNADPGIVDWASQKAIGQPFGARQTGFGAIHRMNDCWKHFLDTRLDENQKVIAVGMENGLVKPIALGQPGSHWFDICFIATKNNNPSCPVIIKRGHGVRTEFEHLDNGDQESFDQAVMKYHEIIMPRVNKKIDLYPTWTKDSPEGPRTREYFLSKCFLNALNEQTMVQRAQQIVIKCAERGVTASGNFRYMDMLWTRDADYMAPIYLSMGFNDQFLQALLTLKKVQYHQHDLYNNGYETFNRFGNLPIVCIAEDNQCHFLRQRIRGTMEKPALQILLWKYCERVSPAILSSFPLPNEIDLFNGIHIEDLHLDTMTRDELVLYYQRLIQFQTQLKNQVTNQKVPEPSFSLVKYIAGELENLTPGTRDSEIHYIRAFFTYLNKHSQDKQALLNEFSESLAQAVFYLYSNVIDPEDGLPRGADSRDIFADILYDSKVLTNAVFWYQALEQLVDHAPIIKNSFLSTISQALATDKKISGNPNSVLEQWTQDPENFSNHLQNELNRLRQSIQTHFFFNNNAFQPIDFLPGNRAEIALDQPVNPTPVAGIVKQENPTFIEGKTVDPQSLALAVLARLIDKVHYDQVIDLFQAADSPIGVQVFVPISGKTKDESLLLQRVKGQVVWPHISWLVVKALISMDTERSLNMAEEQRDKLMALGGCSEWYAIDPETQKPIAGGESEQGWAATMMISAIEDFYNYYSRENREVRP